MLVAVIASFLASIAEIIVHALAKVAEDAAAGGETVIVSLAVRNDKLVRLCVVVLCQS